MVQFCIVRLDTNCLFLVLRVESLIRLECSCSPQVKVLYVRNLKADVTDDQLRSSFEQFGKVERVKKVKDYGFVHFEDRDNALAALAELNGKVFGNFVL